MHFTKSSLLTIFLASSLKKCFGNKLAFEYKLNFSPVFKQLNFLVLEIGSRRSNILTQDGIILTLMRIRNLLMPEELFSDGLGCLFLPSMGRSLSEISPSFL